MNEKTTTAPKGAPRARVRATRVRSASRTPHATTVNPADLTVHNHPLARRHYRVATAAIEGFVDLVEHCVRVLTRASSDWTYEAMAGGESSALLHDSEHLTRLLLRRAWANVPRRQQRLLRLAVRRFDPNKPAIKVAATQVNAAAWLLAAMHWNGCRHPSALWCKPLHPLTGVVRWLSGFDVVEQHEHSREILILLCHKRAIL